MSSIYLLSDGDYRKRYPAHNSLDMSKFYTVVSMEQETTINDVLGDTLYEYLITNYATLSGDEIVLLEKVQTLLVYCVSKSLISFKSDYESYDKDIRALDLDGKISFVKSKIKDYIADSDDLQTLQDNDGTYDSEKYSGSPIHFWS